VGAGGALRHDPLDDWLGDISDDDWSEYPRERVDRPRATPVSETLPSPESELRRDPRSDESPQARPVAVAEAHRAVIQRRRLVAGLMVVVVLGLGVVSAVLLLRGGGQASVTPAPAPPATTSAPRETTPASTPTLPSTSPSTPTPSTTPSTGGASGFTLPEGAKLRRGEGDPAVVQELQQALSEAGYDPGPTDGTFGRRTEAAVVAFQQANGLSVDGVVGPATASALNSALAGG
jgi:hypothetical protein